MTLDLVFFLIAGPAVIFAGISKSGFGSGAAFASASILALVIEPGMALGVMLPLLMLVDLGSLKPYWRKWRARDAKLLILGGLPGVALGAALFRVASPDLLRLLIGGISVAFVLWRIALAADVIRLARTHMSDLAGAFWGVATGFTTFISHAGGPPSAIFLLSRGLSKTEFQATTVLVFWVLNIAKFVPYAALGMFSQQTFLANLVLAPFALLGTWIGVRLHHIVPEKLFYAITYVLLLCTGAKLIFDGLS